jgi:ribosomal protein L37AE/L43A
LGHFPSQAEDALLSLTWLEQARLRVTGEEGELVAGLDVAGPGEDETVLCVRQGPRIMLLRSWSGADPRGDVLAALAPLKARLKSVNVDSVGLGYYMARRLKDHGLPVREVNVGEAARDKEKYANRKAEVYWEFRERACSGDLAGLTDERTIAQLAGIRYRHNSRGQIVIESKDDARKRGVKSPDRAEAVILAFAGLEARSGILEFWRLEAEKARANTSSLAPPPHCPQCDSDHVAGYADYWRCRHCGACGAPGQDAPPPCRRCQSPAVERTAASWRCQQCGFSFNIPPRPYMPTPSDILRYGRGILR